MNDYKKLKCPRCGYDNASFCFSEYPYFICIDCGLQVGFTNIDGKTALAAFKSMSKEVLQK